MPGKADRPDLSIEDSLGLSRIAGVDEVGRGALAGPVTAVALILDRGRLDPALARTIRDSKVLRPEERREIAGRLAGCAAIGEGWAGPAEIERLNILQATLLAMQRAVSALAERTGGLPEMVLVDGPRAPELACPSRTVVRGDSRSLSIAAASIVAKVARDAHMTSLGARHPGYGWERNAGYGTPEHLAALERLGATEAHRRTFAPVRRLRET